MLPPNKRRIYDESLLTGGQGEAKEGENSEQEEEGTMKVGHCRRMLGLRKQAQQKQAERVGRGSMTKNE